jgi:hypothetical protein
MSRYVVDTNVPIVANGGKPQDNQPPSLDCRKAAVTFLLKLLRSGKVVIDLAGEIQAEYRRHLSPSGQPGVGDRFYRDILSSNPGRVQRVELPKTDLGEYADLPQALIDAGFDRSDRKFAALGRREKAPVVNATDSDWLIHRATLKDHGIRVEFVCGCDATTWFGKRP